MSSISVNDQVTVLDGNTIFDVVRIDGDMARIWPAVVEDQRNGQWVSLDLLRPAAPPVKRMAQLVDRLAVAMAAVNAHWSANGFAVDEATGRTGYPFTGHDFDELTANVHTWAVNLDADAA
jgi:hypothetical protein